MRYFGNSTKSWFRARFRLRIVPAYFLLLTYSVLWVISSDAKADDWTSYQHDNQHTGYSSSTLDPTQLHLAWTAPSKFKHPIIVGDRVYALSQVNGPSATITAFDLTSGAIIWNQTEAQYPFAGSLANAQGMIIYNSDDHTTNKLGLKVRDATTGNLLYSIPLQLTTTDPELVPTVYTDPTTHSITAYNFFGGSIRAFDLGANSGSLLWTSAQMASTSIPTLVGNSLIVAGPGQFYAVSRSDGSVNHFQRTATSGGTNASVAYDSIRNQFYIMTDDGSGASINAYSYTDNSHITPLWRYSDSGLLYDYDGLALDGDGNIFTANTALMEISPTGSLLHTFATPSGLTLATGTSPVVSDHYVWISAQRSFPFDDYETLVYDLNTQSLVATLPTGRETTNTSPYQGVGMVGDSFFIADATTTSTTGFSVYTLPDPGGLCLLGIGFMSILIYRGRCHEALNAPTSRQR